MANSEIKKPILSVVIPAYNAADCLDETLRTLENQSLKNIEIICVDDGSTDDTFGIAKRHEALDSRVRSIHQDNAGAGPARNKGFEFAKGDWVAFLDADDIYKPDFLNSMVEAATVAGADIAICEADSLVETTGEVKPWSRFPSFVKGNIFETSQDARHTFQVCNPVPFNKIFNAGFIRERGIKFQDTPNSNDIFFTYAAIACSRKVAIVREPLVSYRISGGASIQDDFFKHPTKAKCLCTQTALAGILSYCKDNGLLNGASKASLDILFVHLAFSALVRGLGDPRLLEEVFYIYQNALVNEWRVSRPSKNAGFETRSKYELLVNSSAEQFAWVYKEAGKSRSGGFARKALLGIKTVLVIAQNIFRGKK